MKNTILYFILFWSVHLAAQFQSVEIGVGGLTCSACSRSVEMSLRKLPFVDSISMNLERTNAKIFFKKIAFVEIEKIANAVVNAGFSVTYLNAEFLFTNTIVSNNFCFSFENNKYQFLLDATKTLNGKKTLHFIGDKYLSKKEMGTWKARMKGIFALSAKEKLYYVTL